MHWGSAGFRRGKGYLVLGIAAVGVGVLFQNCGQPATPDGDSQLVQQASALPFAYDATIDQLAYMSCNNMGGSAIDKSTYFTIRAGAYRTGGIRLTDEFANYPANKKRPKDRIVELLSMSPRNSGTKLQIALRSNANYQGVLTNADGAVDGRDFSNLYAPLGSVDVSTTLMNLYQKGASTGDDLRSRLIRDGTVNGQKLEGNLAFVNGYALADQIRNFLGNDGFLGLTYTQATSFAPGSSTGGVAQQTLARSEGDFTETQPTSGTPVPLVDAKRSVFGKGYRIFFSQPRHYAGGAMNGSFPPIALDRVEEFRLDNINDTTRPQWTCPPAMQFRIVRIQDLTVAGSDCPLIADIQNTDQANLKIVRNSLRVEDWYVNMAKRCIVPKRERLSDSNCYGAGSGTIQNTKIIYDLSQACGFSNSLNICTNFASVCYRQ